MIGYESKSGVVSEEDIKEVLLRRLSRLDLELAMIQMQVQETHEHRLMCA
jgi:hypothetical protein